MLGGRSAPKAMSRPLAARMVCGAAGAGAAASGAATMAGTSSGAALWRRDWWRSRSAPADCRPPVFAKRPRWSGPMAAGRPAEASSSLRPARGLPTSAPPPWRSSRRPAGSLGAAADGTRITATAHGLGGRSPAFRDRADRRPSSQPRRRRRSPRRRRPTSMASMGRSSEGVRLQPEGPRSKSASSAMRPSKGGYS